MCACSISSAPVDPFLKWVLVLGWFSEGGGVGVSMGPIRGLRRRRQEKRAKRVAAGLTGPEAASDWWDVFSKRITGPSSKTCRKKLSSLLKISRKTFNYICSLVMEDMAMKPSNFTFKNGDLLSVNDQVAVALRRLSSGESLLNIGHLFGMNHSTVSQVTWRFVEAMEERGIHHLRWPDSEGDMAAVKAKFEKICNLPNCCGAIDSTHVLMCLSSLDSSNKVWTDNEKNHSMVLQAIVDADMRIRDVVSGWPGSMNESLILQNSGFSKLCEKGMRLNGKAMNLSVSLDLREYIVGDVDFPLLPWLLTPYQTRGKDLTESELEFNRRHSAAKMVAQIALARLKEMWKILQGEMWRPDKHRLPRIILVCCLLHNIIIDLEDEVQEQLQMVQDHDTDYKQEICKMEDKEAYVMRDELSRYLTSKMPP